MARKRKSSRRRSPKMVSLLNVAESYAYANTLTSGLMGTTPVGFITGDQDLTTGTRRVSATGMVDTGSYIMEAYVDNPDGAISLRDIVSQPDASFATVQTNFMNNYQAMAVQAATIGIGFRLGKRLLRRPISNVNRNIFKPLGAGFKL
jgi:hypothetical protein